MASSEHLAELLAGFDPALPLEEASTPPAAWYTDEEVFQRERETVFGRNWLFAARADQLDAPGSYVTGFIGGEPYLVARDEAGGLRAFCNVCRHRATAVASGAGRAAEFVCPYHGWTYGLDGRLLRAPELGGVKNFDREATGLVPLVVEGWGPFVVISRAHAMRPFADQCSELKTRLDQLGFAELQFVRRRTYQIDCNWKVFVDNYLDGGYHVPHLHGGLAGQLELGSYRTELFDNYSIQSCTSGVAGEQAAGPLPALPGEDFSARIGEGALYGWIYPNFMINRYGPGMDTNLVLPLGPDRCEIVFDWYFTETEGGAAEEFIERSIAASDTVQQEDIGVCESVQRGLGSSSYDRGRYSVAREAAQHHFHRLLARDLTS